jgi:ADP-ribose pyrophosphatase
MTKLINESEIYNGPVFRVVSRCIEFDEGCSIKRDLVLKSEVAIVLTYHVMKGKAMMVEQYRPGTNSLDLGFPAGFIDHTDDSPEHAAIREVEEETGYTPSRLEYLGAGDVSSGFTNERAHYFVAFVDGEPDHSRLDEEEGITLRELDIDDLFRRLLSGDIRNNHVSTCLFKLLLKADSGGLMEIMNAGLAGNSQLER